MNILVIEDNPVDLKLICALLESSGHKLTSHSSADGVMSTIRAEQPDILVLDLNLGSVDGLEVVRELRAAVETQAIPVLAITAYPHRYSTAQILDAGCDGWIFKPINTRSLADQIRMLCLRCAPGTSP